MTSISSLAGSRKYKKKKEKHALIKISHSFFKEKQFLSTMHSLEQELLSQKDEEKAKIYARFFKTGKGQYGEGDIFIGISVPQQRAIAKKYKKLSLKELEYFLKNPIHEFRFTSLVILTEKCTKATEKEKKENTLTIGISLIVQHQILLVPISLTKINLFYTNLHNLPLFGIGVWQYLQHSIFSKRNTIKKP